MLIQVPARLGDDDRVACDRVRLGGCELDAETIPGLDYEVIGAAGQAAKRSTCGVQYLLPGKEYIFETEEDRVIRIVDAARLEGCFGR